MNIVITNDAKDIAGGEKYVLYLAKGLKNKNHNVIIAPLQGSDLAAKAKQDFEIIEVEYSAHGKEFGLSKYLANRLRDKHIDIIHTNSNTDRTIGSLTARKLRCGSVAQIHSCHSIRHNPTQWWRNKFWIDHFITDSACSTKILIEQNKIAKDKVSTIHIGIPSDAVRISEKQRVETRKELNVNNNEFLIGAISRFVPFKGHSYLLYAFNKALLTIPNLKLILIGDGELKESLIAQANELGICNKVIFVGYQTELDGFMSALDLFVQPSLDFGGESFPIAVLLSLCAGLPIIASDVSDIKFQVENMHNGFLVQPGNVEMLADKIKVLATNNLMLKQFSQYSLSHFQKNFTIESMVEKIERIYNTVLK
jgi:glycosyltransferase involved in cell wall biosynthesis